MNEVMNETEDRFEIRAFIGGIEKRGSDKYIGMNEVKRSITNTKIKGDKINMNKKQTDLFQEFIENRESPKGITTHENSPVIPKGLLEAVDLKEDIFKFRDIVTSVEVDRKEGIQPVLRDTTETLDKVDQLAEEPPIPFKPFIPVEYDVETYRGYAVLSNELVDDGLIGSNDIEKLLVRLVTNTENKNILDELNKIEDTPAGTEKDLRDLLTEFKRTSNVKFYVTQEAYNNLDQAGLVKQSLKFEDGAVFGKELVNIEGEGNTMFIGNLKELIFLDRSISTMNYENYLHYGLSINVASRFDVQLMDKSQIKKVLFTA